MERVRRASRIVGGRAATTPRRVGALVLAHVGARRDMRASGARPPRAAVEQGTAQATSRGAAAPPAPPSAVRERSSARRLSSARERAVASKSRRAPLQPFLHGAPAYPHCAASRLAAARARADERVGLPQRGARVEPLADRSRPRRASSAARERGDRRPARRRRSAPARERARRRRRRKSEARPPKARRHRPAATARTSERRARRRTGRARAVAARARSFDDRRSRRAASARARRATASRRSRRRPERRSTQRLAEGAAQRAAPRNRRVVATAARESTSVSTVERDALPGAPPLWYCSQSRRPRRRAAPAVHGVAEHLRRRALRRRPGHLGKGGRRSRCCDEGARGERRARRRRPRRAAARAARRRRHMRHQKAAAPAPPPSSSEARAPRRRARATGDGGTGSERRRRVAPEPRNLGGGELRQPSAPSTFRLVAAARGVGYRAATAISSSSFPVAAFGNGGVRSQRACPSRRQATTAAFVAAAALGVGEVDAARASRLTRARARTDAPEVWYFAQIAKPTTRSRSASATLAARRTRRRSRRRRRDGDGEARARWSPRFEAPAEGEEVAPS